MKINRKLIPDIVNAYCKNHTPMITIAKRYGITRMAVWKILAKRGVRCADYGKITVECACGCGEKIIKYRSRYRSNIRFFKDQKHYGLWKSIHDRMRLNNEAWAEIWTRVSDVVPKEAGMVVHFDDDDENNTNLENIKIFKGPMDHAKYHRGEAVVPVFDGNDPKMKEHYASKKSCVS